jgi:hypothetical protein
MGAVIDAGRLAAYVDGALEPEEAAQVVMHLADNPEDRERVSRLTELNALLVAAYAAPLSQPVPERIRRAVDPASGGGGNVVPFRTRGAATAVVATLVALAAGVMLVFGFGPLWRSTVPGAPGVGPVPGGSELQMALETGPSGSVVSFPDGDEVTLIATFLDGRGRPCREFELLHDTATEFSRGIACRGADAAWAVAVVVSEPLGGEPDPEAGYMPAAGAIDAALSGALDVLGAGPSLAPDAERELMAAGWTTGTNRP